MFLLKGDCFCYSKFFMFSKAATPLYTEAVVWMQHRLLCGGLLPRLAWLHLSQSCILLCTAVAELTLKGFLHHEDYTGYLNVKFLHKWVFFIDQQLIILSFPSNINKLKKSWCLWKHPITLQCFAHHSCLFTLSWDIDFNHCYKYQLHQGLEYFSVCYQPSSESILLLQKHAAFYPRWLHLAIPKPCSKSRGKAAVLFLLLLEHIWFCTVTVTIVTTANVTKTLTIDKHGLILSLLCFGKFSKNKKILKIHDPV